MVSVKSISTCAWLRLSAFFVGGIMEKKTEPEQNKKESIWRDKNGQHPEGKCSSGMTFRAEEKPKKVV